MNQKPLMAIIYHLWESVFSVWGQGGDREMVEEKV